MGILCRAFYFDLRRGNTLFVFAAHTTRHNHHTPVRLISSFSYTAALLAVHSTKVRNLVKLLFFVNNFIFLMQVALPKKLSAIF